MTIIKQRVGYDEDFYGWAYDQAAKLRTGQLKELDIDNIAEELESLGRSEKRELVNRLAVLLTHLMKWQYQPERRGKSWRSTIKEQRRKLQQHLSENPSLRPKLQEAIAEAHQDAVSEMIRVTPFDEKDLPAHCLYTQTQIFNQDFWPNEGNDQTE